MSISQIAVVWFRKDFRTDDNPALFEATKIRSIIPVYIIDENNCSIRKPGKAARIWIAESLIDLNKSLDHHLKIYSGNTITILKTLLSRYKAEALYWNTTYDPEQDKYDEQIRTEILKDHPNIIIRNFNARLLWEPSELRKKNGDTYRLFTAFKNKVMEEKLEPRFPIPSPPKIRYCKEINIPELASVTPEKIIKDKDHCFEQGIYKQWKISEQDAHVLLQEFVDKKLDNYHIDRDYPGKNGTSTLSPYINFGQISPNRIWFALVRFLPQSIQFLTELLWREFAYNILNTNPELGSQNLQQKFDYFPWENDKQKFKLWSRGETGYPIVDAGIRELLSTGYMHNRVRMIVGSFLTKNLLIHWKYGEEFFWEYLVDADPASNTFNWQWIAGSGADSVPYFRIFSPTTQTKKFDPQLQYSDKWLPEYRSTCFTPVHLQEKCRTPVEPVVEEKVSRKKALTAFRIANTRYRKSL
ncbi:deoxyribodipyrimidine photolyase [Neorickettsia risticii str. Illinois]|uniref:Deoxyribodipyrimidine photolyase n=1 Tax=Neorickettsia risticii (strain Illinois) TaxID=434131 RepID=C6V5V6_NEORI|nr:deoxyribodipyrimidine photo-lyase [Neorickettsia risticii]ACT69770.1 deoxyribodipyrimidine photolyase [Neorickettsia risticii str. Illinois]